MIDLTQLETISNSAFKKRVNELAESVKTVSEKAHYLGLLGIKKASEHGDFTQLSEILKVNLRGLRREAFIKWVKDFTPAKYQKSKDQFVKDKSDTANEFDLEGANESPFWVHSSEMVEPEALNFEKLILNIRRNLERKLKKSEDDERVSDEEMGKIVQAIVKMQETIDTLEEDLGDNPADQF